MGSPEMYGSQESQKDKLMQSGIAKIAFDMLTFDKDIKAGLISVEDCDFKVSYLPNRDNPVITVEIPNVDEETKDRVPKRKIFVSDDTVGLNQNLNEEQKQILKELADNVGIVNEEPDDLIKEKIKKVESEGVKE